MTHSSLERIADKAAFASFEKHFVTFPSKSCSTLPISTSITCDSTGMCNHTFLKLSYKTLQWNRKYLKTHPDHLLRTAPAIEMWLSKRGRREEEKEKQESFTKSITHHANFQPILGGGIDLSFKNVLPNIHNTLVLLVRDPNVNDAIGYWAAMKNKQLRQCNHPGNLRILGKTSPSAPPKKKFKVKYKFERLWTFSSETDYGNKSCHLHISPLFYSCLKGPSRNASILILNFYRIHPK